MTDRPILFSGPMVRALLDSRKSQTRRVMNPQPALQMNGFYHVHNRHGGLVNVPEEDVGREALDYIAFDVGDRLYVREAWRVPAQDDKIAPRDLDRQIIGYEADCGPGQISATGKFRQGMHMPRWASRLTLTVTEVRVQRVGEISREDEVAEGVAEGEHYDSLWDSLNAKRGFGFYDVNPWVVAVSFTVEKRNIDAPVSP